MEATIRERPLIEKILFMYISVVPESTRTNINLEGGGMGYVGRDMVVVHNISA